jgi:hypothetical protein
MTRKALQEIDPNVPTTGKRRRLEGLLQSPRPRRRAKAVEVEDVAADGNCLFSCVSMALGDMGLAVSVRQLRAAVSARVDESQFRLLRDLYRSAAGQRGRGQAGLVRDYSFMRGVRSLGDLRRVIETGTSYYGDELALGALERAYPLRLVVVVMDPASGGPQLARRFRDEEDPPKENDPAPLHAVLVLDRPRQHYSLMKFLGRRVMTRAQLPVRLASGLYGEAE